MRQVINFDVPVSISNSKRNLPRYTLKQPFEKFILIIDFITFRLEQTYYYDSCMLQLRKHINNCISDVRITFRHETQHHHFHSKRISLTQKFVKIDLSLRIQNTRI